MVLSENTADFTCLFCSEEILDDTRTLAMVLLSAADIWAAESGPTVPTSFLLLLYIGNLPLNIPTLILHKAPIKLRELTLLWGKGGGRTF